MADGKDTHSGLSVGTLLIAGTASAVAAIVIPMLWRPGTVFAAAMTPVVVALVSEALKRPVDTVSSVRPRKTPRRSEPLDARFDEPFDPLAPPSAQELEELPPALATPVAVHRRRPLTARQWKLALATGLAAFAIVAAVFTASELLAGDAVSGGSRTTFFGGGSGSSNGAGEAEEEPAREERREQSDPTPAATPEATGTPVPEATTEPAPEATETPVPTPAAPAPAEPTPAP